MMRRILVTGNGGLLGLAVVNALEQSQQFAPVLFRTPQKPRNICDEQDCLEALEGVDGVIHLASCQPFKNSREEEYVLVNTEGTLRLRRIALEKKIWPFIFASSQDVYDLSAVPENGFDENSKTAPASFYAKSKLEAEAKLNSLNQRGLLIFRLSVLAGDRVHPHSFLSFLLESIKKARTIEVLGRGQRIYDFISTEDVARVFIKSLQDNLQGLYNLGAGSRITIDEIARTAGELTGASIKYLADKSEKPGGYLNCRKLFTRMRVSRTPLRDILKALFVAQGMMVCEKILS